MTECPYQRSSLMNDFFLGWVFQSIRKYSRTPPSASTVYEIPQNLDYVFQLNSFKAMWKLQLKCAEPRFLKTIVRLFRKEYLIAYFILLFGISINLVQAILINYLVIFLESTSQPGYQGALLALAFCTATILSVVAKANSGLRASLISGKLKSIIALIVSKKVLKLNYSTVSEESNRGKIINVVNSDMEAFELLNFTMYLFCSPLFVIFSIMVVVGFFGPVGLIGIAVSVIHVPFVMLIGKISMKFRVTFGKAGDVRVKMIENFIEGIKIMKLYAWELPFLEIINQQRKKQINEQGKIVNYSGVTQVFSIAGITLSIFSTLAIQVYLGTLLRPGEVFLLINVFYATHINIVYITTIGANTLFMLLAVMKRIESVLLMNRFENKLSDPRKKYAISLEAASVSWREDRKVFEKPEQSDISTTQILPSKSLYKECLSEISFKVRPKELVLIVGPVASGKTSLLISLLGELNIVSGSISVKGSVSFASEDPWIISGTIKENILMGKTLDQDLYTSTLNSCALIRDLRILGNGDETLVGDRGITLSGGQRARLCLARAVYSQSEILLLDDPLSAVDPEVANEIFHHCIKDQLKEKTVVLVTHQIQFLSQADKIIVLDSGTIAFCGTYDELQKDQKANELLGDIRGDIERKKSKRPEKVNHEVEETNEKLVIEVEEVASSTVKIKNYWRYLKYGFKSLWIFAVLLIFILFSQVCYLAVIYWAALWCKEPTHSEQDISYYFVGFAVLVIIAYCTIIIRVYIPINLFLRSNIDLHNQALKGIALSPSVYFDKNPTGRIINRFTKDISVVDGPLQFYLYEFMSTTILLLGNVLVVVIIVPYSLIAFPFWAAVFFFLFKYVSPIIFVLKRMELVSRTPLVSSLNVMLNGLTTIRCMKFQKKFSTELSLNVQNYLRTYITFHIFMRFNQFYADLGSTLIVILNIIVIVATRGYIPSGLAAFNLSMSTSILGVASIWSKNILELESNMSAAQRLLDYTDLPTEGIYTTNANHQITKGHIIFDNIFLKYRPEFPFVLSGLSFEIQPGEKVGIVGRTGAGKSSVLQVLFRLVNPHSGKILLDGVDHMQMGVHEIRQQMSVIPQNAVLFNGSIRTNLDPLNFYSDEEIWKSLSEVNLKDDICGHGQGLEVEVKSDGVSLSAGQKQLLCLARAILRKNKIIMMDEATANVDNETDKLIQKTVKKKFVGSSLLIIAHRIRTIIKSDKIIVVDSGVCKEFGSPRDLIKKDSMFLSMIHSTGPEESAFLLSNLN